LIKQIIPGNKVISTEVWDVAVWFDVERSGRDSDVKWVHEDI
jgi:hypothetical protein